MVDQKIKILVVDDFSTMRRIVKNLLKELGFANVDEAEDGAVALQKLQEGGFDFVVTDWNMPNMDGLTFVKHFRQTNKTTPMIMVTTEAEKARVIEAIKAGVNNYVVKPFTPDLLSQRINETLAKCQQSAQAA